jgi:membrane protease YdiL (CAAX protease family)
MDFNFRRPTHILALFLILGTFLIFIFIPILNFIGLTPSMDISQMPEIPDSYQQIFEIFILFIQLILVIGFLIFFPFLWYILVNNCSIRQFFSRILLIKEGINNAILWGVIGSIVALVILMIIGAILTITGFNLEDASNIQDLEMYFSPVAIVVLILLQPIAEEIFFRGFLLDKISSLYGEKIAILSTAGFFGLAHLIYGNTYPALMTGVIGILLAYLVVKTKNLYSSIIAHILFNVISFSLYTIGKSIGI